MADDMLAASELTERVWDAIVLGTGIAESVLVAALAKDGKKVLHLDNNTYYGDEYGNPTLREFESWVKAHGDVEEVAGEGGGGEGTKGFVMKGGPEGCVGVVVPTFASTSVLPPSATLGSDATPVRDARVVIGKVWQSSASLPRPLTTRTLIDRTPMAILSQGSVVEALVASDSHKYLDFITLEGVMVGEVGEDDGVGERVADGGAVSGGGGVEGGVGGEEGRGVEGEEGSATDVAETPAPDNSSPPPSPLSSSVVRFSDVPCSKSDVFTSSSLSLGEKRSLMRFLGWAFDRAMAVDPRDMAMRGRKGAGVVAALNEVGYLGKGRSLRRPQNKVVGSGDGGSGLGVLGGVGGDGWEEEGLEEFLEVSCGLGRRLCDVIAFSMAHIPRRGVVQAGVGMERIQSHLRAMSRFGRTAYILPIYGSGELPQAFVRTGSVAGSITALAAGIKAILVGEGKEEEEEEEEEGEQGSGEEEKGEKEVEGGEKEVEGGDGGEGDDEKLDQTSTSRPSRKETPVHLVSSFNEMRIGEEGKGEEGKGEDVEGSGEEGCGVEDMKESRAIGVVSLYGTVLRARHVVSATSYLPLPASTPLPSVLRVVMVTSSPVLQSGAADAAAAATARDRGIPAKTAERLWATILPPPTTSTSPLHSLVHVLQTGSTTNVTSAGHFVTHFTAQGPELEMAEEGGNSWREDATSKATTALEDLKRIALSALPQAARKSTVFLAGFVSVRPPADAFKSLPENLHVAAPLAVHGGTEPVRMDSEADTDVAVRIFEKISPEGFLFEKAKPEPASEESTTSEKTPPPPPTGESDDPLDDLADDAFDAFLE